MRKIRSEEKIIFTKVAERKTLCAEELIVAQSMKKRGWLKGKENFQLTLAGRIRHLLGYHPFKVFRIDKY